MKEVLIKAFNVDIAKLLQARVFSNRLTSEIRNTGEAKIFKEIKQRPQCGIVFF